jgi:hypothetical protein
MESLIVLVANSHACTLVQMGKSLVIYTKLEHLVIPV